MARDRTAEFFAVGKPVRQTAARPGTFILTHGGSLLDRMIRFGEGIRFHGSDKDFSFWNHAAFVIEDGKIVQATAKGVVQGVLADVTGQPAALVDPKMSVEDTAEAVAFVKAQIGAEYGYLTFVGVALHALTGGSLIVGLDGTEICSGLVARALERGPWTFARRDASQATPADLAKAFDVRKPTAW